MSLTILLGDYGAGKTRSAKYLAKQYNGIYLNVDLISDIRFLAKIIEPGKNYFLDGWPKQYSYEVLANELKTEIKLAVCMASPDTIIRRQKNKAIQVTTELPRAISDVLRIIYTTVCTALTYDDNPLFIDTTSYPPTFLYKSSWLNHWMEVCLTARFKGAYEYQDVEIAGYSIIGLSKSHKTWERLNAIIDFKGKSVCDYGCNYGFFCFKAEEAGADRVIGIDVSPGITSLASSIGMTKNSKVLFETAELKNYSPPNSDIIMALNVLHHTGNNHHILKNIFRHAQTAIFEIPIDDIKVITKVANGYNHGAEIIINSHREDRCIVIYSNHQELSVPKQYKYQGKHSSKKLKYLVIHLIRMITFGRVGLLRKIYLRRFR